MLADYHSTSNLSDTKTAELKEISTMKKGRCLLWTPTIKAGKDFPAPGIGLGEIGNGNSDRGRFAVQQ